MSKDSIENTRSDLSESWRHYKEYRDKKKKSNQRYSTALLDKYNVKYVSHNNGVHLIVEDYIDFWPSTGKFKTRGTFKTGRGIDNLLRLLGKLPCKTPQKNL